MCSGFHGMLGAEMHRLYFTKAVYLKHCKWIQPCRHIILVDMLILVMHSTINYPGIHNTLTDACPIENIILVDILTFLDTFIIVYIIMVDMLTHVDTFNHIDFFSVDMLTFVDTFNHEIIIL